MVLPEWASDPDVLERMLLASLDDGDIEGVGHALKFMAFCDPARAQRLYDELQAALHMAAGGEVRVQIVPVGDRPDRSMSIGEMT